MKRFKKILMVFVIGICLGILLSFIRIKLRIPEDVFARFYWTFAFGIILGAVVFNVVYNLKYQKRLKEAYPLFEEGKAQEYISEVEKLLKTAKGRTLRNVLTINLAAGYILDNQYFRAINLLAPLTDEKLKGAVKMVQRLNLCLCYFYTGQNEKAVKLYDESKKEFDKYRSSGNYEAEIAVLDIFAAIEKGQTDFAEELLEKIRGCNKPGLQEEIKKIEELMKNNKN